MRSKTVWFALIAIVVIGFSAYAIRHKSTTSTTTSTIVSTDVTYPCISGGTALAALQTKFPVDTKDTSFGKQVMAINHVNPTDKQYWAFYIDGVSATVGADAYQCKGTETIAWKLASF